MHQPPRPARVETVPAGLADKHVWLTGRPGPSSKGPGLRPLGLPIAASNTALCVLVVNYAALRDHQESPVSIALLTGLLVHGYMAADSGYDV